MIWPMKIATWNIERLSHKSKSPEIAALCEQAAADIFVLTESDTQLKLNYEYCFNTLPLPDTQSYKPTERRVQIYTNYNLVRQYPTFDEHTAICVELETPQGNLLVYGTIIGIYGNRNKNFMADLSQQVDDITRLAAENKNLCVCGDFNCTFSDNYYYTKVGRTALNEVFKSNDISLLTRNQPECIDHIAISARFVRDKSVSINEWNFDRKLSDHKGIVVGLE